eukprot:93415_1
MPPRCPITKIETPIQQQYCPNIMPSFHNNQPHHYYNNNTNNCQMQSNGYYGSYGSHEHYCVLHGQTHKVQNVRYNPMVNPMSTNQYCHNNNYNYNDYNHY